MIKPKLSLTLSLILFLLVLTACSSKAAVPETGLVTIKIAVLPVLDTLPKTLTLSLFQQVLPQKEMNWLLLDRLMG